ncbi:MAG: radical SAM protein [Pseudomonadales bacterium]|nr:radical SAM protein [Pseudomonadales bacterium]
MFPLHRSRESGASDKLALTGGNAGSVFHFVMIKPSHYDDEGYPIQWYRSLIPSNSLACLNGLAEDANRRQVLGPDVEIRMHTIDETNQRVRVDKIIRMIQRSGGQGLIGLIGVQSNQFPRAVDIARPFRAAGLPVVIGGFHVSGCLAMLPEMPVEMLEAQSLGISFFAGEAEEGRLDILLRDAHGGSLEALYNFMDDLPDLADAPMPILPAAHLQRTMDTQSSIDLGRGCPYQCSFCTIINVQGRKSRVRSPDELERCIRDNLAQGVNRFFITDDNFARNQGWEALFDRLIQLREGEGLNIRFIIQVDTLCHKIPNFIEKAARAGVKRAFIGLENINPDNLLAARKRQNKITEYRDMLQKWKWHGVTTYAGYILGFPGDTRESILRDVEIIKRELPLDLLEFFILTPLPGSEDHKVLLDKGEWMDPDLNKYDLHHRVSHHPRMSDKEWDEVYKAAWKAYYTPAHIETIMRRSAVGPRPKAPRLLSLMLWFYATIAIENVHPLEGGYFRLKYRRDRRHGLPLENPCRFYVRYATETVCKHLHFCALILRQLPGYLRVRFSINPGAYTDLSLTHADRASEESLGLFNGTRGGDEYLARSRRSAELVAQARQ